MVNCYAMLKSSVSNHMEKNQPCILLFLSADPSPTQSWPSFWMSPAHPLGPPGQQSVPLLPSAQLSLISLPSHYLVNRSGHYDSVENVMVPSEGSRYHLDHDGVSLTHDLLHCDMTSCCITTAQLQKATTSTALAPTWMATGATLGNELFKVLLHANHSSAVTRRIHASGTKVRKAQCLLWHSRLRGMTSLCHFAITCIDTVHVCV